MLQNLNKFLSSRKKHTKAIMGENRGGEGGSHKWGSEREGGEFKKVDLSASCIKR